jgi:hypothetical protein
LFAVSEDSNVPADLASKTASKTVSQPESARSDEQKECRKIVIRTGLRIAQKSGFLLVGGIAIAIIGAVVGKPAMIPAIVAGAVLIVLSLPLISTGKKLARTDSSFLAAIDEPKRIEEVHIAEDLKGGRQALALRLRDGGIQQVALLPEELAVLRTYFKGNGVVTKLVDGNSVVRSIRPNISHN